MPAGACPSWGSRSKPPVWRCSFSISPHVREEMSCRVAMRAARSSRSQSFGENPGLTWESENSGAMSSAEISASAKGAPFLVAGRFPLMVMTRPAAS